VTIHQRLEHVFRTVFNNDDLVLTDQTTASDVPGWDSVEHINLMFSLEEEFGMQFVGHELAELQDIGAHKRLLEQRSNRHAAA
jgi:acyl carrier protein